MTRKIVCPACRALGSGRDCVERLRHAQREDPEPAVQVTEYDQPEYADLEVVIRFAHPVEVDGQSLIHKAAALRDELLESPESVMRLLDEYSSYDLQVLTPAEHG